MTSGGQYTRETRTGAESPCFQESSLESVRNSLTFDMEDQVSVDYSFPETAITDDRDCVILARVQEKATSPQEGTRPVE